MSNKPKCRKIWINLCYRNLQYTENRFHVDFKVDRVFPQMKSKKYSTIDVLAYFGGTLGLLTGFSFISAVEILYIFVLKPLHTSTKNSKHFRMCHRVSSKVSPLPASEERETTFFKKYLQESSIHSLNYIANEQSLVERLGWITNNGTHDYERCSESLLSLQIGLFNYSTFRHFSLKILTVPLEVTCIVTNNPP